MTQTTTIPTKQEILQDLETIRSLRERHGEDYVVRLLILSCSDNRKANELRRVLDYSSDLNIECIQTILKD